jgi:hypothetical protein
MDRFHLYVILLALVVAAGCATIEPKPFEDYRDAFVEVKRSSDRVLSVDYEWTYRTYVEKLAAGEDVSPVDLVLEFPLGDYEWELPSDNLLARVRQTQNGLSELNAAFADYTILLADLAGGVVSDSARFDEQAVTLNERAQSAARALEFDDSADQWALFSAAGMALAREYLGRHRKKALEEIISENQAGVDLFAREASDAVKIVARDLKAEYQNHAGRVTTEWLEASETGRKRLAKELLNLNADMIAYLGALEILDSSYAVLARKHAELGRSLAKGEFSAGELLDAAERLDIQYEEFKGAGE